jgi:hypothetical protein
MLTNETLENLQRFVAVTGEVNLPGSRPSDICLKRIDENEPEEEQG